MKDPEKSSKYLRYSKALQSKRLPAAFVDLDLFDQNLEALAKRAHPLKIRVASKSVRCVSLIRRALEHPSYQGVLCYRGYEAVHLAKHGIDDLVVAYPIWEEEEIKAVCAEMRNGRRIVLMCDRPEHLERLETVASSERVTLPISLDIDLSNRWPVLYFGVRRSSISTEEGIRALLSKLGGCKHLRLEGVMGYEAQIAGVADSSFLIRFLKKLAVPEVNARRQKLVDAVKAAGHALRFVNGGGTGSLESTKEDPSVTEVTVGSGLYSPTLFDSYFQFHHEAAAGYVLQVTRKPTEDIATCAFGGYPASGTTEKSKSPKPFLPAGLTLLPHEGAGEVQTPVKGEAARGLQIGDLVFFRHAKAGELCERFNELHLIWHHEVRETVPTYRGEGMNFG